MNTPLQQQQLQTEQQPHHHDTQYINQSHTSVPNYLQSDTDDSAAISYQQQSQNDESDFDFSVKS